MSRRGQPWKVPFDRDGNQMHYANPEAKANPDALPFSPVPAEWKNQYEFTATLEFDGMRSGRSAKYLTLHDSYHGHTYTMFITDLLDLLHNGSISAGRVAARWKFVKRGQNYGVALA